jgi:drug/metabolite transporter (DMT)-like permease
MSPDPRRLAVPVLTAGILAVSTSSILIRLAAVPALSVTFYRLAGGALLFTLAAVLRRGALPWRALERGEGRPAAFAALALALHFITWILSLEYTTVVSSVVLVTTTPIWAAVGSSRFLGERPGRVVWMGIGVAVAGGAVIAFGDSGAGSGRFDPTMLLGDVLALAGAVCMAVYLVSGRRLRRRLDTVTYVSVVYGGAALAALVAVAFTGSPVTGFSSRTWLYLALIILLPQVIGHTSYNWALGFLSATLTAVIALLEPIGAGLLAWWVLGELPGPLSLLGAGMVLLGVAVVAVGETRRPPTVPAG